MNKVKGNIFSLRKDKGKLCPLSSFLYNIMLEVLAGKLNKGEKIKQITQLTWKGRSKTVYIHDVMIANMEKTL